MSADVPTGAWGRRLIAPDEVGPRGLALEIEFDAAERKALAGRLDLLALEQLGAALRFEPADDAEGAIRVGGTIRARLAQSCVVTLEPVPRALSESISVLYAPLPEDLSEHEVAVLAEGEEAEPLPADGIDVGELVAEHLALFLDPYPRHPDAPDEPLSYTSGEAEPGNDTSGVDVDAGPFAALGQLKSKL